ncbi:phage antirepressor KilAC domain-containing protein [Pseudobacillus sp. FSL P4-0506]|uniref:phage antirepressor KilAC domain-containing protein n=1 Tax=Pseudobacillus sp. FSL P4-0506 TaxID=2921576 RepID=UPI0030FAAD74
MNQLKTFKHDVFGELPVIIIDGIEWFGATDAAKSLSFGNPYDALKNHVDDDDLAIHEVIDNLGRKQNKKFINESGLYSLIIGASKQGNNKEIKEKAKRFKRWLTADVLPTIRKTGGYVANDDLFIQTYLPHADEQTKMMFRTTLGAVKKLNEEIAVMKPKAEYFDALVDRSLLTNFRDTAKQLKVGQKELIDWLLDNKFVYRDQSKKLRPYMQYVPELFDMKDWERNQKAGVQTYITPKGKETFRLLLEKRKEA